MSKSFQYFSIFCLIHLSLVGCAGKNGSTALNEPLGTEQHETLTPQQELNHNIVATTKSVIASSPTSEYTIDFETTLIEVLQNHPDVLESESRVREHEYYVSGAKKRIFPTIEATASVVRDNYGHTIQSYGVGFDTVLWDGTYTKNIKLQVMRQMAEEARLKAVKRSLTLQTYSKYLGLLKANGAAMATRDRFEVSSRVYGQVKTAWSLGFADDQLLYEAEAAFQNSKLLKTQGEGNIKIACRELLSLVGKGQASQCANPRPVASPVFNIPTTDDEALILAFKNRPEIAIDLALVESAELGHALARAEYYPKVILTTQYGYSNNPFGPTGGFSTGGTSQFEDDWSVGIVVKIPIFDFGKKKAAKSAALEKVRQAEASLENTKRTVAEDVLTNIIRLETASLGLDVAKSGEKSARNLYEDSLNAYKFGTLSLTDLLDRVASYSEARQKVLEADFNLVQSLVGLQTSLGVE